MDLDFENMTPEAVLEKFGQKFNCAQIVFAHAADHLGLDPDTALKIPAVFGGGMHHGDMCGAVTGALMAIGLKYGNNSPDDACTVNFALQKQKEFEEKFMDRHNGLTCRELLGGLDFGKPDDVPKIVQSGLTATLCPQLVADACEILDEVLNDD